MTRGVTPLAASTPAASSTNVSPRKRGSRPTSTVRPSPGWPATYRAIPVTARRIFARVNSSATTARQPEVPNLIGVAMSSFFCTSLSPQPWEQGRPHSRMHARRAGICARDEARPGAGGRPGLVSCCFARGHADSFTGSYRQRDCAASCRVGGNPRRSPARATPTLG